MNEFKFKTPQESIGLQFWKLHSKWQKRVTAELSQYKVTHTQFVILASIKWFQKESIKPSQTEISTVTGIDKMTLSKAIIRLESLSLIKRTQNNKDARAICVSLTNTSNKLIPKLLRVVETIDTEVFSTKNVSDKVLFTKIITELNTLS